MKKIIYTAILLGILTTTQMGCKKDFLNQKPYSLTVTDTYYTTEQEAINGLVGCYTVMNALQIQNISPSLGGGGILFGEQLLFVLNGSTDELVNRPGATSAVTPYGIADYNSSSDIMRQTWFAFYNGIQQTNLVIEKVDGINMNDTRKQQIKAEAKFLRGLYHMYLAMMYGDIPINITSTPDEKQARQPVQAVYTQIIADMKEAYAVLPDRNARVGGANKWTAAGFLVRIYTYLGSCKKFIKNEAIAGNQNNFDWVDDNQMYQDAVTVSKDIIDHSGYKLTNKYDYLFRETTKSFQYEECLLSVESSSSSSAGPYNRWGRAWVPQGNSTSVGGGTKLFSPLVEIYDRYNVNDFRRSQNLTNNIPQLANNPTSEIIEGVKYFVPNAANINNANFGIGKYRHMDPAAKTAPNWASQGNYPLLRYAEILLARAEALYFTGDEPGARALFTEVRQRAIRNGTNVSVLDNNYKKTDFIEELLDERSRELCFECMRRFDLSRFGRYTQTVNALSETRGIHSPGATILKANWQPYKIWFPIPLTERDLNPNLKQNTGYSSN